jgi:hypothetical protein
MMRERDLHGAELPLFGWPAAFVEEMLMHLGGISKESGLAYRLHPSPGGISRASRRAATAPMFSSSANDDWVGFIGANELFA